MNLDNYIKTILSGVKTWAQSTFAKKSDIKDMYYDHRSFATTPEVTVNDVVGTWGYVKVADALDFDVNKIVSMTRYGNDGLEFVDVPITVNRSFGVTNLVYDDYWLGLYFQTQQEANAWYGSNENNPFTPGLYLWLDLDEGESCSISCSLTWADGELRKVDQKYIPLATEDHPGAVHPWIGDSIDQPVWMNAADGALYTRSNTYQLPVASVTTLGGVKPVAKTTSMTQSVGVDGQGKLYTQPCGIAPIAKTATMTQQVGVGTDRALYTTPYTLPIANASKLGGVKPVAKTTEMTEDVGIDSAGKLYAKKSGVGQSVGNNAEIFNNYSSNEATGEYSHAEGTGTTASGDRSHAEGGGTTASGERSHAEGQSTTASGSGSHAEGNGTTASAAYSHAEGLMTTASGQAAHAEGAMTEATKASSHAEGNACKATASAAHAEGDSSQASGTGSHAEGVSSQASGYGSHAEGEGTLASSRCQHVQGFFNVEDAEQLYLHIVGNGDSETRSNAHTLDQHGNAWFAGDIYVGSTSGTNKDDGSQKLVTMADVEASIDESIQEALADFEVGNATISWDSF